MDTAPQNMPDDDCRVCLGDGWVNGADGPEDCYACGGTGH